MFGQKENKRSENKRKAKKNKQKYQTFSHVFLLFHNCFLVSLSGNCICQILMDIYIRFQCLATWAIWGVRLFQSQLSIFVAISCWGWDQLTHICTSFGYFQDNPSTSFIISMPALCKFPHHFWAFSQF